MNISILLLKNGTYIISLTEELEFEPRCHLENPFTISGNQNHTFTRWPNYTNDVDILLHSDSILTLCEPTEEIQDKYLKKIGKTKEDLTKKTKPVILNEDIDPDDLNWEDDEYEPRYVETE